jgi:hypothetical protein
VGLWNAGDHDVLLMLAGNFVPAGLVDSNIHKVVLPPHYFSQDACVLGIWDK